MAQTEVIHLQEVVDISGAGELSSQLQEVLSANKPVALNGSEIDRVDTAALQCLTVFFRDAEQDGLHVEWQSPPTDNLKKAADLLGLSKTLKL